MGIYVDLQKKSPEGGLKKTVLKFFPKFTEKHSATGVTF